MNVNERDIDSMWRKLNFTVENRADVIATLVVGGKVIIRTRRSHGARKLSGNIPNFIRQDMHLNSRQFADAIACPLGATDYLLILCQKGFIEDPDVC